VIVYFASDMYMKHTVCTYVYASQSHLSKSMFIAAGERLVLSWYMYVHSGTVTILPSGVSA